jgi:hypothetical protein
MTLQDYVLGRKAALARTWYERILATYPPESARLLARHTTSFANPIGQTMVPALEAILEGLAGDADPESLRSPIDAVVRIRAVQQLRPGTALVFLLQLKQLFREEAADGGFPTAELSRFEDRIDGAMLLAFDLYTACREQIHRLRLQQREREQELATPRCYRRPAGTETDG